MKAASLLTGTSYFTSHPNHHISDGTHFRYILNFLRDGTISIPTDKDILRELATEAHYYQITDLLVLLGEENPSAPIDNTSSVVKILTFSLFSFLKTVPYNNKDFEDDGIIHYLLTDNGQQKYPKNPLESAGTVTSVFIQINKQIKSMCLLLLKMQIIPIPI